jgi:uncharacterized protein YjbI with pentapeptide repeats
VAADLVNADLSDADLFRANLQDANMQGVNLGKTYVVKADLKATNLSWANLQRANLLGADLSQAILCDASLVEANLFRVRFAAANLQQAILQESVCEAAQFDGAKLGAANFHKADLTGASLYKVDAVGTDFSRAVLTGACIEDWNISSSTDLQGVVCDYIYLQENNQERRPHGSDFQPGEFTQRFQKFLETVDLFFVDGVDWKAFLTSFQDLQLQYGDENLAVQGIERKGQSSFEIRLAVPPEADKAELERVAYERYEINLKALEAQYQQQLVLTEQYRQQADELKDELLDAYRQQAKQPGADMMEVVKLLASRPINVEATAVADNQSKQTTYDQRYAKFGGGFAAEGGIQIGGTLNDLSQTEDLTEAANKIQQLLTQLQSQSASEDAAQEEAAKALAAQAQQDPTLIGKLVNWGKALGGDASNAATSEAAKVAGGQAAKVVITKALTLLGLSLL